MPRRVRRWLRELSTVALSLFSLMALGWVTDGLNGTPVLPDLFSPWWPEPYERGAVGPHAEGVGFWLWLLPLLMLVLALLASSLAALGRLRRPLVREVAAPQPVRPRRVLVAMLSRLDPVMLDELRCWLDRRKEDTCRLEALFEHLEGRRWNGEPLLRGLHAHIERLERLYLLVTPESRASCEPLAALLGEIFPKLRLEQCPVADGSDLHRIYQALTLLERQLDDEGIAAGEIVIDATGGQKPYSMAAAFATLHSELSLQYAHCEGGGWCVQEYSVEAIRSNR